MFRILTIAAGLLLGATTVASTVRADEKPTPASDAANKQLKVLVDEFETDGNARESAGRFIKLAEQHSKSPVAVDALAWVVVNVSRGKDLERAITLLTKEYVRSERLAPLCGRLPDRPSLASESLLRELRAKSPHKSVRAQASFYLAVYLQRQLALIDAFKKDETKRPQFEQFYGKSFTGHLARHDTIASLKEIESIYEDVVRSFPDVKVDDSTMAETARRQLYAIRNLSIGRTAPEITGQDVDDKTFKLSDYRGKVVLLDFWGHW
jgi:hypothetical protein